MKRGGADPEEEEALAWKQRDVEDARYEFAMRLIWVVLGNARVYGISGQRLFFRRPAQAG